MRANDSVITLRRVSVWSFSPFPEKARLATGRLRRAGSIFSPGAEGFILRRVEEAGRDVRPRLAHDVYDDVLWVLSAHPVRRQQA